MPERKYHTSRAEFVDPRVQEIPVTKDIIDKIMPHFPVNCKVISGFLSEEQLYWKVNYHWEYLLDLIDHTLTLDIGNKHQKALEAIRKVLLSNLPDPMTGYTSSNTPGLPKDKSSHETILERHKLLRQAKKDFKSVVDAVDLKRKSKRSPVSFDLACAPVAAPAKGKHSTGYALDIKGDNLEIIAIAAKLGAVKPFNEQSHVHCEFPNGVTIPALGAAATGADRAKGAVKTQIDSKITNVRNRAV
jgi:hypothetical protein